MVDPGLGEGGGGGGGVGGGPASLDISETVPGEEGWAGEEGCHVGLS